MLDRIKAGPHPFTFTDLYAAGNLAIGATATDQTSPAYRWADALIQKERKAGRILQESRGKWMPRGDAL